MTDNKILKERELLIDTEDYSIGKDGLFVNKNNLPLLDIIYDLSLKVYSLKEKEKEYEELKNTALTKCPNCNSEYLTPKGIELYEENKKLKKECEELKEENQKLEMQLCNDCGERDDYNIPCKMIRDLDYGLQKEIEENDRYRKALEEIEEYCNDYCMDDCIGDERLRTFDKCQQCISGDILDIINKAKDSNNDKM